MPILPSSLIKGRLAEALVEAVLLEAEYRVVRSGRESQVQAILDRGDTGYAADFVVWKRVERGGRERALHDVLMLEIKYRGQLETWLPEICEQLLRRRGDRRAELHVVLVTDNPASGQSCFQILRLSDYVPGGPPSTQDLCKADLGIDKAITDKYEPLVKAMFGAFQLSDRKREVKLAARSATADLSRGASEPARVKLADSAS